MTLNLQWDSCSTLPRATCKYSPHVFLILDLQEWDLLRFMSEWDSNQSVKWTLSHLLLILTSAGKITFCSKSAELSPRGWWKNTCIIYPWRTSVALLTERWTGWAPLTEFITTTYEWRATQEAAFSWFTLPIVHSPSSLFVVAIHVSLAVMSVSPSSVTIKVPWVLFSQVRRCNCSWWEH